LILDFFQYLIKQKKYKMSTVTITAADVNKLRTQTGAGMMDCKKALMESNGDFEQAIDYLRKKGQKVAANRGDREAKEGQVIARITADAKRGAIICLNCETDFVAINEDFANFAQKILDVAINENPASLEALTELSIDGTPIKDRIIDYVGKIGEKIELSRYEVVNAEKVIAYIHPGNKLATLVGFNKASVSEKISKDVAMQAAAMAPVALDKDDIDSGILEREIEIGKEQARAEGKPEEMLEKIALGKLQKFYKESTLLNQEFIKDNKLTVLQYIKSEDKDLTATAFKRVSLG
jgi:elongation factor Ts